jgi:hypothetical protein
MTSPLSPEAVAQMVTDLRAADKPLIQSGPFIQTRERLRTAADMLTTLAAENAVLRADAAKALQWAKEQHACADEYAAEVVALRASEAAAMEALAEIGAVVTAIEGADSLDKEIIRNIRTRIAALTPTSDKEPNNGRL